MSWVRFPHGALLALGGRSSPDPQNFQVGYLPGLSVWSLHVLPSLTKDGQFTSLGPGQLQAAHCSWGVLEEGRSRIGKKQKINSPRPQAYLRVCVGPVSPPFMHV